MKRRLASLEGTFGAAELLIRSAASLGSISEKLLELLGTALDCDWGTFWEVDGSARVLRPVATWSRLGAKVMELEADTRGRALSLSEGTAGHVWRSRKPIWTSNLFRDMCLPRSLDAGFAGLQGGVWFPLKTDDAVYGILEFLGTSLPDAGGDLLTGIEGFGIRIGHEIERTFRKTP
jgi:GAF domain-containing protein